jgi:uncharacterized protein DUF3467
MPKKHKSTEAAPAAAPHAMPQSFEFVEPSGGHTLVYANHVQIGQSPFDIKLGFGEMLGTGEGGKARVLSKATVTMTWLEAKVLSDLLSTILAAYESQNGPFTIPKISKVASPSELLRAPE